MLQQPEGLAHGVAGHPGLGRDPGLGHLVARRQPPLGDPLAHEDHHGPRGGRGDAAPSAAAPAPCSHAPDHRPRSQLVQHLWTDR
ncbi:hypothetical protein [Ornithinimicrobium kibberense]|uniref:hypothetical protein n=1 Tax=Ornithinimicrobium kibberense TaxID=282060 RepID=UPI00360E2B97